MDFGYKLRKLRIQHNLTQQELGNILFISNKAIYKYEMGLSEPCLEMVVSIAKYFRVTTDFLLIDDELKTVNFGDKSKRNKCGVENMRGVFNENGACLNANDENKQEINKETTIVSAQPPLRKCSIINCIGILENKDLFYKFMYKISSKTTYFMYLIKCITNGSCDSTLFINELNILKDYIKKFIDFDNPVFGDNYLFYYLMQINSKFNEILTLANESLDYMHCVEIKRQLFKLQKILLLALPNQDNYQK